MLFERLADVEREARGALNPPDAERVEIAYAGGHRIALETESIIRREATWNTVTSVAAILLLLLIVFRSAWLFVVGAIPMAVATLGSIAINGMIQDRLSAAATGTSALLFGLGIDGLVLMYVHYLEACASGDNTDAAIGRLTDAGTSMLLGCFTTAATFFALTWIDMPGLQELGRLVGVGMLLGGPLTLVLVPALLPARASRRPPLSAAALARFAPPAAAPRSRGGGSADAGCRPSCTGLESRPSPPATAAGYAGRPATQRTADTIRYRS